MQRFATRGMVARNAAIARPIACNAASGRREMLASVTLGAASIAFSRNVAAAAGADEFVTAPNGLKYKDEVVGSGPAPAKGARIKAHYTGRLVSNGQKFDSSYDRGQPLAFQVGVGMVIKGWDIGILGGEGITPMQEGGKRKLIIPAELGYGARGAGGVIPPNAALEFDVELVAANAKGGLDELAEGVQKAWKKATSFLDAV